MLGGVFTGSHDGHRERLRQRYISNGFDSIEEHVVLEMLLGYGIPRKDVNELAHTLINKYGSIRNVLSAPMKSLTEVKGVTENCAVLLRLLGDISEMENENGKKKNVWLNNPKAMAEYFIPLFRNCTKESVYVASLSNNMKLLHAEKLYEGDINSVKFHIRDITSAAILKNASKIVIAHNHVKGSSFPSSADLDTTRRIADSLASNSIELTEHIIVKDDDWTAVLQAMGLKNW